MAITASKDLIPFSLDSAWLAKLLQDNSTAVEYDEVLGLIQAKGISEIKCTPIQSEYSLEGDNGIVDVQTVLEGYDLEWTNGIMTFDEMKLLENGTVESILDTDGSTIIGYRYVNKSSDKPNFFGVVGAVDSQNMKVAFPKCKVTSVEISFANKEYAVLSVKAKAIRRDNDKAMRFLSYTDTLKAPSIDDLK